MSKRINDDHYNEAKRLFIEEQLGPKKISELMGGVVHRNTVQNWSKKKDKSGKTWFDYREERRMQKYERLTPRRRADKILEQIDYYLNLDPVEFNNEKAWDALSKLNKQFKDITDESFYFPYLLEMLTDLSTFLQKSHPDLATPDLMRAILDFKNIKKNSILGRQ